MKSGYLLVISGVLLAAIIVGIALVAAGRESYGVATLFFVVPLFAWAYRHGNRMEAHENDIAFVANKRRFEELVELSKAPGYKFSVAGSPMSQWSAWLFLVIGSLILLNKIPPSSAVSVSDVGLIIAGVFLLLLGILVLIYLFYMSGKPLIEMAWDGFSTPNHRLVRWEDVLRIEMFDIKVRSARLKGIDFLTRNSKTIRVQVHKAEDSFEVIYMLSKYFWITRTGVTHEWDYSLCDAENKTLVELDQLLSKGIDKYALDDPGSPEVKLLEDAHRIISRKS